VHHRDKLAMDCIRQANLDAIWAREPSTITGNLNQAWKLEDFGNSLCFFERDTRTGSNYLVKYLWNESGVLHLVEVA
jgi:hypothetical protein